MSTTDWIWTCLTYHAACKVEFQPFNQSYSQLTFSIFYESCLVRYLGASRGTLCARTSKGQARRTSVQSFPIHRSRSLWCCRCTMIPRLYPSSVSCSRNPYGPQPLPLLPVQRVTRDKTLLLDPCQNSYVRQCVSYTNFSIKRVFFQHSCVEESSAKTSKNI